MSIVYAMQRANGDWFALDEQGRTRVPVFHSSYEAGQARAQNLDMLLFTPVLLNESALRDLTPHLGLLVDFWLVDIASPNLKRGRLMDHAQLGRYVHSSAREV